MYSNITADPVWTGIYVISLINSRGITITFTPSNTYHYSSVNYLKPQQSTCKIIEESFNNFPVFLELDRIIKHTNYYKNIIGM